MGVGLGVLGELMAEEVDEVVGPRDQRGAACELPALRRPRPLARLVLEQMLAGVSTRRFARTREPVVEEVEAKARSVSKSAISREFVARTRENLDALMSRRLDDVRPAVMMIDGIEIKGRTNVVALGITTEGVKLPLGLWEGSTENATVATALPSDLVDRGLDPEQAILFVIDGAKALRKAIRAVFGERALVHRCVRHKERNVLEHVSERDRPAVKRRLRRAGAETDHDRALDQLRLLASGAELRRTAAAAAVRRRFAPHQLRHAHAVEMAREGVRLIVIQRQLRHSNLGITSVYLQGIDSGEIIEIVHARRAPMVPDSASLRH